MANRSVKVVLQAQVDQYVRTMKAAAQSTEKLDEAAKKTNNTTAKQAKALKTLAPALLGIGTATVAGLGASAKAAIDWESAWAGVMKTVDASPAQFAEIEDGLRGLTRVLPASHEEIAGVAQAAGQLGVEAGNVVTFTKTMIDLGEATNLTAEEAATSIAQISNVMGTMDREGVEGVERLGAALVDLGNNSATTEADILKMSQRLAGAGATVGATEADVLALSATLASMGVRAELGGGVATRVLLKMRTAVDEGGESLESFAGVAGTSADEFSKAFSEDPVEALALVAGGIDRANESGENITSTLSDMGIKGTEEVQVMLALANSGDLLTESLDRGADAWSKNSALVEEAQQRYATTESKIKIAWNTIKDAAIDAGAVILPVVAGLAEGVASLVTWFSDLPGPVQGAVGALGGIVGVGAGALGLFVAMAPRIRDTRDALKTLVPAGGRARGVLAGLGRAAAGVAVVGTVAPMLNDMIPKQLPPDVESLTDAMLKLGDSAGSLEDLDSIFEDTRGFMSNTGIDDLGEALQVIGNPTLGQNVGNVITNVVSLGQMDTGALQFAREQFEGLDSTLTNMVQSGSTEEAAAAYEKIAEKAEEMGVPTEKMVEIFPEYSRLLAENATQAKLASDNSEELNTALDEVGVSASGAVTEMDKFLESLFEGGILQRDAAAANRAFEAAIDGVTESVKTNGTTLDVTTAKGRANEESLYAIADAGRDATTAMANQGESQEALQDKLSDTYDSLITAAGQFGITGGAADELAREILDIPDDVEVDSWMDSEAKITAEQTTAAVEALDGKNATVTTTERHVRTFETRGTPFRPAPSTTSSLLSGNTSFRATGGRLPHRASGGRLPYTGLGTDAILGIGSDGTPTAMVDDGEWVIREENARKYNRELEMINAGTFPKLANGGIPAGGGMPLSSGAATTVSMPSQVVVQIGPGGPKMLADVVDEQVQNRTRNQKSLYR